ncbi:MAG: tetratricopeptide repeat protein [candidate division WOR-3 bacterium]
MAEQDFSEIARLAERYNKDPKSRIFVQLADAYRKNNMVDEALEVLKQGLQYHPQYPLAYLILGKCYFDKRMYAQSKEALEKTIEFDPINIVALRTLAQVCDALRDEACQLKAYKGIVSVDPSDEMARNRLKELEARQRKGPVYTMTLAQEYEQQGNLQEALNVYEQLGFMDPSDLVIKQKIKELRDKISGVVQEVKKEEEKKVAELKLENYFQPEEISVAPTIETPKPPDSALGEHIIDLEKEIVPPVIEEAKPEPFVETKEPVKAKEPEEVLSLEEFLVEPLSPKEEVKPAEVVEEPGQPPVIGETPDKAAPAEVVLEEFVEQPVIEEKPAEKEAKMKIEEPEPAEMIEPRAEESIQEFIVRTDEAKTPTPAEPVKEVSVEPSVEDIQKITTPEPAEKPIEERPVEEKPPVAEEEKKKEETPKPKEEDFKSFQDWLSSLLK